MMKLELQNQGMKENQIRLSCEEKMNQKDANQSTYSTGHVNDCMTADINCSSIEDFDDTVNGIRAPVPPSSKKPSDSYVDKTVMECQLSKTVVCYKEINVNDVKDICIDERVSSLDYFFSESKDEKPICRILPPEEDKNECFIKQKKTCEVSKSIVVDRIPSIENRFVKDWTICDDFKNLAHKMEEKINMTDPELPTREVVKESYDSKTSENDGNEVAITDVQISVRKENLEGPASVSKAVEPCSGNSAPNSEANFPNDNNLTSESALAYYSEVENGSIKFNFNSLTPEANDGEELDGHNNLNRSAPMASSTANEESCQSSNSAVETHVSSTVEVGTSDTRLVSSQTQYDIGESSFSVEDPLASLVTYSGPIAYSGNISLRSESSAASTRSFAFPVLQSEWNSSPVKMVKADRRHYRKYRGWREGLLCCRF